MLTLAAHAGPRVCERIGLNCGDVVLGTAAHARCHGKGRNQRAVPLTTDAQAVLATWLSERRGRFEDPLFSTRTGRRLSRDAVKQRVSTHAKTAATASASLKTKKLHPHVLRHTAAMRLLHAGVDTSVIALWLGHYAGDLVKGDRLGGVRARRASRSRTRAGCALA
ncbi:MAG: tyrosine-type recombinase/integrase [Actinobacteria bacterium]|nr:tyrosine-type recombinase/integrase [Actinomycetota bacterium]